MPAGIPKKKNGMPADIPKKKNGMPIGIQRKMSCMPVGILDNPFRACLRRAAVGLGFALRPTHFVRRPHGRCWTLRGQCCPLYPLLSPLAAVAATVPRSSAVLPRPVVQPGTNYYSHYVDYKRHNN